MSDACNSDHCVTCSDDGVPVRVIEPHEDGIAVCADEAGSSREVMTDLVGAVAPGDELLVHAGVAIGRLE